MLRRNLKEEILLERSDRKSQIDRLSVFSWHVSWGVSRCFGSMFNAVVLCLDNLVSARFVVLRFGFSLLWSFLLFLASVEVMWSYNARTQRSAFLRRLYCHQHFEVCIKFTQEFSRKNFQDPIHDKTPAALNFWLIRCRIKQKWFWRKLIAGN